MRPKTVDPDPQFGVFNNSLFQGDQMEIADDSDPDWWVARHLVTGETGHIPRNYVALQSSIECEE